MPRPTLLVVEPESLQALSVRKLVLETAKFNVLTAHSNREGLDLFHMFPNISAAVVTMTEPIDAEALTKSIKATTGKVPVIALFSRIGQKCPGADHDVSTLEPQELLDLARSMLGDPRQLDSNQQQGQ